MIRARAVTAVPTFAYEYGSYATRDAPRVTALPVYQGIELQNAPSTVVASVQNGTCALLVPTEGSSQFMSAGFGIHHMDLKITIGGAGAAATMDVEAVVLY